MLPLALKVALVFRDETHAMTRGIPKPVCPSYALVIRTQPRFAWKVTAGLTQVETTRTPAKLLFKADLL